MAAAIVPAVLGCGSVCGNYEAALNRCGQSFNRANCDENVSQCSTADDQTIDNASSCMQNPSVCNNGSVVSGAGFAACTLPLASVSSNCRSAIF
jgi:hypothetical protein